MGDTKIEWTEKSWNPIAAYFEGKRGWMCSKPSPGCKNCYSERLNLRLGNGLLYTAENAAKVDWQLVNLDEPGKWRKPSKCFVESMGDLFHEALPDELIGRIWSKMLEYPQHTFQVLTKRTRRMGELIARFTEEAERKGLRTAEHIWVGTSVENQKEKRRIDELRKIPAAVRFLSCEPLIEDLGEMDLTGIHWVIVGGESGHGARPMEVEWVSEIQNQCEEAGVPFFFKQWGENFPVDQWEFTPELVLTDEQANSAFARVGKKTAGRLLYGRTWDQMPQVVAA